ncbi:MAG TPA: cytochrome c [Streptosporangiaceae bacterium]|nr:cytochrome c [Streptosporangiaceae bacterium]
MSWITARRRRPAAGYAVVLLGLIAVGVVYAAFTSQGSPAAASAPPASQQQIALGRKIFVQDCSSCHGLLAQGTTTGPSLIGVGAAAVDFQVSTGRMPGKDIAAEMPRKPRVLNTEQTHAVAAYIASLGGGPAIPDASQVSTKGADTGLGQQLFTANCSQCHNFVGAGGALTYGKYAPALTASTPTQIYEAMLTGSEAMPVFNDTTITPSEKRDIIAYVTQTRSVPNPGGLSLGRIGPVTEGLVGWIGGVGALVLVALWITAKRRVH